MRIKRNSQKTLFIVLLCIALFCYIFYHFLHGNRGLFALFEIQRIVEIEKQKARELEGEIEQLVRWVSLLRPQSLDKDMLDERARSVLNMAQDNEVIINADEIPQN
jgi:cell division protein FtsB